VLATALLVAFVLFAMCRNISMLDPVSGSLPALLLVLLAGMYAGAFLANAAYLAIRLRTAARAGEARSPNWRGLLLPPAWYALAAYIAVFVPQILTAAFSSYEPPYSTIGYVVIAVGAPPLVYALLSLGYSTAKASLTAALNPTSDNR
jgi:hypothetical protein